MKKHGLLKFIALCLVISANSLHAQTLDSNKTFLNRLEGNWFAKGKAFGMPADITMKWEPALQGRFMKISYSMAMHAKDGTTQLFEGTAFYKSIGDKNYTATWFDSGGEVHPIAAASDDSAMTSIWGTPETKLGKTIYRFVDSNSIEIVDLIRRKDGEWKEFNRNTLLKRTD